MPETSPNTLSREQRLSALCATGCGGLAAAMPVAVTALWAFGSWEVLSMVRQVPPDIVPYLPTPFPAWQRVMGALVSLVPALILSWGLLRARASLRAFARGEFFASAVVDGLRDYAAATFWAAIAGLVSIPVLSVALTFGNPTGHRELSLDLSGTQLLSLVGAGIVWVIASAMSRAAGIARENEQFV